MLQEEILQKLEEEPIFDITAETAKSLTVERRRLSITATNSLVSILTGMHQELIRLNQKISKLEEKLEEYEKVVEDKEIRMYSIQRAIEDKDWVEPDELFEI